MRMITVREQSEGVPMRPDKCVLAGRGKACGMQSRHFGTPHQSLIIVSKATLGAQLLDRPASLQKYITCMHVNHPSKLLRSMYKIAAAYMHMPHACLSAAQHASAWCSAHHLDLLARQAALLIEGRIRLCTVQDHLVAACLFGGGDKRLDDPGPCRQNMLAPAKEAMHTLYGF
jgi:hypothetical protein